MIARLRSGLARAAADPRQRGEGLLSLLLYIGGLALIITFVGTLLTLATLTLRVKNATEQTARINDAMNRYLQINISAIQAALLLGPVQITFANLQAQNLLDPTVSPTNPYGQAHYGVAAITPQGLIMLMTATQGGQPLETYLADLASNFLGNYGGYGGYMRYDTPTVVKASYGSLQNLDLSTRLPAALIPQSGDLVLFNFVDPTAIGGQAFDVVGSYIVANGSIVNKPTCPGSLNPGIILNPVLISADPAGDLFNEFDARAASISATQWSVTIDVRVAATYLNPAAVDAQASALVVCGP